MPVTTLLGLSGSLRWTYHFLRLCGVLLASDGRGLRWEGRRGDRLSVGATWSTSMVAVTPIADKGFGADESRLFDGWRGCGLCTTAVRDIG
jgi:hypothetical protein